MADEKTTPTPKAGVTDTMHSTKDAPDRSKDADDPTKGEGYVAPEPNLHPAEEGYKSVSPTEDAGTLVTNIPSAEDVQSGKVEGSNPQGDDLAVQPGENPDDRKGKDTKASDAKSSTKR